MAVTGAWKRANHHRPVGCFGPEGRATYTAKDPAGTTTGSTRDVLGMHEVDAPSAPAGRACVPDGPRPVRSLDTSAPRPCRSHRNPEDGPCR